VRADPVEIERVLINLAVNARDAMPTGGVLTIETSNVEIDQAYAGVLQGIRPGPFVLLAISDTGSGMTAEVREHLFEPFFTTKEEGKGTGLGLSTVYRIVTEYGGDIRVYSEPGRGTIFRIYLPRVEEGAERSPHPLPDEGLPHGSETILVLEDEDYVRALAVRMLRRLGYNVLVASTGEEAIESFRTSEEGVDLLLTDVIMPGMSGQEVADTLRSANPGIGVLYMSGYAEVPTTYHRERGLSEALLQKPFTVEGLASKMRQVLDAREG